MVAAAAFVVSREREAFGAQQAGQNFFKRAGPQTQAASKKGRTSNSASSFSADSISSVLARGALVTAAVRTPRARSQAIHSVSPGVRRSLDAVVRW